MFKCSLFTACQELPKQSVVSAPDKLQYMAGGGEGVAALSVCVEEGHISQAHFSCMSTLHVLMIWKGAIPSQDQVQLLSSKGFGVFWFFTSNLCTTMTMT